MAKQTPTGLAKALAELALEDFTPHYGQLAGRFADHPRWRQLADLGTEPWLDTGDIEEIGRLWARPFSAVTTNNTLLNREVQKGQYDELVRRTAALLRTRAGRRVEPAELAVEIGFVLNARHALKLVEAFDAFVSVEEHTDLADDADGALEYARRFHAVCPQRFYVKIPFTPAGLIAARRAGDEGIGVNLTLGFSARQNYLAARFARPRFVNVFLGRLNAFVADNGLGDGRGVGEKALWASQRAIRALERRRDLPTRQIAASVRSGEQVADLAGADVVTMPAAAAERFCAGEAGLADRGADDWPIRLADGVAPADAAILDKLWDVPDALADACDELDRRDPAKLTPRSLVKLLADHGLGDLLVRWSKAQAAASRREGKIPRLDRWGDKLRAGRFGLDALMNLAGLQAFAADQAAMDQRIADALAR